MFFLCIRSLWIEKFQMGAIVVLPTVTWPIARINGMTSVDRMIQFVASSMVYRPTRIFCNSWIVLSETKRSSSNLLLECLQKAEYNFCKLGIALQECSFCNAQYRLHQRNYFPFVSAINYSFILVKSLERYLDTELRKVERSNGLFLFSRSRALLSWIGMSWISSFIVGGFLE